MRGERGRTGAGLLVVLAVAGCSPEREARPTESRPAAAAHVAAAAPASPADVEREMELARTGILARGDSAREAFDRARGLTREERAELRRDVNAEQVATARRLGVRASGEEEIERLRRQGRLVALEDSTEYWVLRDLDYSRPYVTPDTRAMLVEAGRRFHARLDSLGLPRYRMEVTSVLRTAETQADLRSVNSNAAAGVSAHEFGTTLDVSHVRFAPPAAAALVVEVPSAPELTPQFRVVEATVLEEVGRERAVALQGELGRVLGEMREEGKLRVMMERRQPVYHMTVARRFPAGEDRVPGR
ncbi:MAG TPA: DUF5715 family protein [Longimicrobiaceae bacterium]|nr:DUF5715 family protein [Longimicrobiaceae bacterium]